MKDAEGPASLAAKKSTHRGDPHPQGTGRGQGYTPFPIRRYPPFPRGPFIP